jgi:predicted RNA binding protein YcfA (HicA-like mRNA interferase family)
MVGGRHPAARRVVFWEILRRIDCLAVKRYNIKQRRMSMPTVEKIIEKMKQQPNGIRLTEAEKVIEAYGYRFARQNGSHRHYINGEGNLITLKDPLKKAYVVEILRRVVGD